MIFSKLSGPAFLMALVFAFISSFAYFLITLPHTWGNPIRTFIFGAIGFAHALLVAYLVSKGKTLMGFVLIPVFLLELVVVNLFSLLGPFVEQGPVAVVFSVVFSLLDPIVLGQLAIVALATYCLEKWLRRGAKTVVSVQEGNISTPSQAHSGRATLIKLGLAVMLAVLTLVSVAVSIEFFRALAVGAHSFDRWGRLGLSDCIWSSIIFAFWSYFLVELAARRASARSRLSSIGGIAGTTIIVLVLIFVAFTLFISKDPVLHGQSGWLFFEVILGLLSPIGWIFALAFLAVYLTALFVIEKMVHRFEL